MHDWHGQVDDIIGGEAPLAPPLCIFESRQTLDDRPAGRHVVRQHGAQVLLGVFVFHHHPQPRRFVIKPESWILFFQDAADAFGENRLIIAQVAHDLEHAPAIVAIPYRDRLRLADIGQDMRQGLGGLLQTFQQPPIGKSLQFDASFSLEPLTRCAGRRPA